MTVIAALGLVFLLCWLWWYLPPQPHLHCESIAATYADSLKSERLLNAGLTRAAQIQAERIEEAERLFERIQASPAAHPEIERWLKK